MSSLGIFYNPRHIAVVGASPGKVGFPNLALANLARSPGGATITAVHPRGEPVDGFPSSPSLASLGYTPDLCVVGVRASLVPGVLRDCAAMGVPAVVVVASGFAEQGTAEGQALQEEVAEIRRKSAMRIIGPNTMGVANFTSGPVSIASANIPLQVPSGNVAIVSQSGGVATTLLQRGIEAGVRFATLTTLGNEIDVSVPEVVEHMAERPEVGVILCYIEAVRDIGKFRHAAEQCAALGKPLIVLKGGRTSAGARATASHTGALAADDAIWRGALRQFGAIEAQGIDHALSTAAIFSRYGLSTGPAVGGFATGGGGMVLLTDMLVSAGVSLPNLSPSTQERIKSLLPDVTPHNPFEMGGQILSGDGSNLGGAIDALSQDVSINALTFLILPMVEMRARVLCGALVNALDKVSKPAIVLSYDGRRLDSATSRRFVERGYPVLDPPEVGAAALKSWLEFKPRAEVSAPMSDHISEAAATATTFVRRARDAGQRAILEHEGKLLLASFGIRIPPERLVTSEADAVTAANELGYPVALKVLSAGMMHRGVGRGVLLNLNTPDAVQDGFRSIREATAALPDAEILLQKMVPKGFEFILGAVRDPSLGLAIAIGRGGVDVEEKADAFFCVHPVASNYLIRQLEAWPPTTLLRKRYGDEAVRQLEIAAEATSSFLSAVGDQLEELDLNPIIVTERDATLVDALMVLRSN